MKEKDEIKVVSESWRGKISDLIKGLIRKKFDCNVDIRINELYAVNADGTSHLHLSVDAEIDTDELDRMLKNIGV